MRTFLILVASAALQVATFADPITGASGQQLTFKPWSDPAESAALSDQGAVKIVQRHSEVQIVSQDQTSRSLPLKVVYDRDGRNFLLTEPHEKVFVMGGVICGVKDKGNNVLIRKSDKAKAASIDDELQSLQGRFARNPSAIESTSGAACVLDARFVFGMDALVPEMNAKPYTSIFSVNAVAMDDARIGLSLKSRANKDLHLSLKHDFSVVDASVDGKSILLVRDPRYPRSLPDWGLPYPVTVPSVGGSVSGVGCVKSLPAGVLPPESESLRAMLLETGDYWVGPAECRMALTEAGPIGFLLSVKDTLLVYRGKKLDSSKSAISAFEDELMAVEFELASGQFPPDASLTFAELIASDARISREMELTLAKCVFQGDQFIVQVEVTEPKLMLRMRTSPDLRILGSDIVSTRVIWTFE